MFRTSNKDKHIEILGENVFTYVKLKIVKMKHSNKDKFIEFLTKILSIYAM